MGIHMDVPTYKHNYAECEVMPSRISEIMQMHDPSLSVLSSSQINTDACCPHVFAQKGEKDTEGY